MLLYGKRQDYNDLSEVPIHKIREYEPVKDSYNDIDLEYPPKTAYTRITMLSYGTIVIFDEEDYQAVSYRPGVREPLARFHAMYREGGWLDMGDGRLAVRQKVSSGYTCVDSRTGEKTEDMTPEELFSAQPAVCSRLIEKEKEFVLLNGRGMFVKKEDGGDWEQRLSLNDTVMYDPSFRLNSLLMDGENFYALSDDQLYYYSPEIIKKEDRKELVIVSLWPDEFIRSANVRFQLLHPEARIDYQIMMEKEFPEKSETEEAIRRLNTEIISGKRMDVLITDGLPFADYGEKGVLEDLSNIAGELSKTEFYKEPMTGYEQDGKLYSLITSFCPIAFATKEDVTDAVITLDGLEEFLEKNEESTFFVPEVYAQDGALETVLYEIYFPYVKDKQGMVSKEKLRTWLKVWNTIHKRMQGYTASASAARYTLIEASRLLEEESPGAAAMLSEYSNSFMWASPMHDSRLRLIPSLRFIPGTAVGLCRQSAEKELAEEFFTLLFSDEMQKKVVSFIPVRIKNHLQNLENNIAWGEENEGWIPGKALKQPDYGDLLMYVPKEEELNSLIQMYGQAMIPFSVIREYRPNTDYVLQILHDCSERFLAGDMTLEQAVENTYQNILLQEQEQN